MTKKSVFNLKHNYNLSNKKLSPNVVSRLFFLWILRLFYKGYHQDLEEADLSPPQREYSAELASEKLDKYAFDIMPSLICSACLSLSVSAFITQNHVIYRAPVHDAPRITGILITRLKLFVNTDDTTNYTTVYYFSMERRWLEEQAAAKRAGRRPSLKRALFKAFYASLFRGGMLDLTGVMLRILTPVLFTELLMYWSENRTMSRETAIMYAVAMGLISCLEAFCRQHSRFYGTQLGMKLRVAISSLVFQKIMQMDIGKVSTGQLINLLSNDLHRLDNGFLFIHYFWTMPLQLSTVLYLAYMNAGIVSLMGILLFAVIGTPLIVTLGRMVGKERLKTALKSDDRVKIVNEIINGIQVIKMYAWELPFEKSIHEKRNNELKYIGNASLLWTFTFGLSMYMWRIMLFVTAVTFVVLGHELTANIIYPLNQYMNLVQINIIILISLALTNGAEMLVSLKRAEDILLLECRNNYQNTESRMNLNVFSKLNNCEVTKEWSVKPLSYKVTREDNAKNEDKSDKSSEQVDGTINLGNVSASWSSDPKLLAIKNVTLSICKDKLYAVIGAVGSGKSSLLQMLLNELPVMAGNVSIHGRISYASQEPWLFPGTIRDNILFGLPYDAEKYDKVCNICALKMDFIQLPNADQTFVGERGFALSGGQRARVNLARAVYRQADIYLLDDPLSAVDTNVGRQLFEDCISKYLRNKTRILVTHQIHFVKAADYIIVIDKGCIVKMGTFKELMATKSDIANILSELQDDNGSEIATSVDCSNNLRRKAINVLNGIEIKKQQLPSEQRQRGGIKMDILAQYIKTNGYYAAFCVIVLILASGIATGSDYWLSYWLNQMSAQNVTANRTNTEGGLYKQVGRLTTLQYMLIYGCTVAATFIMTNVRVVLAMRLFQSASRRLHNAMLSSVLRGVMSFFSTNSAGAVLNRFSKDMGAVDEFFPRGLTSVCQIHCSVLFIFVLNIITLYWTSVPSVILIVTYFVFIKIYLRSAQSIKRIEGINKSPVLGLMSSSIEGIATVRSAGAESRLIEKFNQFQDDHTTAWYCYLAGWFTCAIVIDLMCIIYTAVIIFAFLYLDYDGVIPAANVGLAITQTTFLTATLQYGAMLLIDLLSHMVSVERIVDYTRVETEHCLLDGHIKTPENWPSRGSVSFKNVFLKYSRNATPVLKNINIKIESGWKVGIVGRTGAGKSSLISAIFRFAFLEGSIFIDDVDTSLVALQDIRMKISIIPQEPVLFSGSVRYNLDPFEVYNDDAIWRALEQVDLKSTIPSLEYKLTSDGTNFSVGQKQLLCLARAILRSNKILIIDEATANVDPQTDNFIQETIRSRFSSCTVLTIAHRLNTIMDSDRVLVMDSGCVAEFDHPFTLLCDTSSRLSKMVQEAGDKTSHRLLGVAEAAFNRSNLKETLN